MLVFAKPSLRTNRSFQAAAHELGGHSVFFATSQSTLGVEETWREFAKSASRYVAAIVARLFAHDDILELAQHADVPVVNALTNRGHPCQTLADLLTIEEEVGLRNANVAYVGDGNNNVTHSLMLACGKLGVPLRIACPRTMRPEVEVERAARDDAECRGSDLTVTDDPKAAVRGANVVYTDTWMSYHIPKRQRNRRERTLRRFQVNEALLRLADDAIFLHCFPATRGNEVTKAVLEGSRSRVFDQAENRLHTEKALLLWLLTPEPGQGGRDLGPEPPMFPPAPGSRPPGGPTPAAWPTG